MVGILAVNPESRIRVGYNLFDAVAGFLEWNQCCVGVTRWDSLDLLAKQCIVDIGSPYSTKPGIVLESQQHMLPESGRLDERNHRRKSSQRLPFQRSRLGIRFLTCCSGRGGNRQVNELIPYSSRVSQLADMRGEWYRVRKAGA